MSTLVENKQTQNISFNFLLEIVNSRLMALLPEGELLVQRVMEGTKHYQVDFPACL